MGLIPVGATIFFALSPIKDCLRAAKNGHSESQVLYPIAILPTQIFYAVEVEVVETLPCQGRESGFMSRLPRHF